MTRLAFAFAGAAISGGPVNPFLRRKTRHSDDAELDAEVHETSPDLAYELQSKMFDQLATVGVAGAGLAVTLIGSVLRDAPNDVWLSVVLFVIAAVTAISGNQRLVDGLTRREPCMRRSKRDVQIALMLVGMAIGWLSMSVFAESVRRDASVASAVTER
jgi:hypothetical protein